MLLDLHNVRSVIDCCTLVLRRARRCSWTPDVALFVRLEVASLSSLVHISHFIN
ncbi:hypothetical protein Hanom_Chr12g01115321 [Helianthus anomalus]